MTGTYTDGASEAEREEVGGLVLVTFCLVFGALTLLRTEKQQA